MVKKVRFCALLILMPAIVISGSAYGESLKQSMEGGTEIEITHPGTVIAGRHFGVAVLVQNNGWEDKQDVELVFNSDDIVPVKDSRVRIARMTPGSSHGETLDFKTAPETLAGSYFLNLEYSQILLEGNENPRKPARTSIAIPISVLEQPGINIHTITPESIFAGGEFPFTVEVTSDHIDISNVQIRIVPPDDIEFRGEMLHTFSSMRKSEPVSITSRIITSTGEISSEYRIPFQIHVSYNDGIGEERSDSKTVSMVLRPRTFMELTTDGGIWIGGFFIAPYVSLGTIVGIPAGVLVSFLIRKRQKTKKLRRRR